MLELDLTVENTTLVWPMTAMAALTLLTYVVMIARRLSAFKAGKVDVSKYDVYQDLKEPAPVAQAVRHVANLFEMPVLFFVACIVSDLYGLTDQGQLILAWLYFGFRFAHSGIQLTYNTVAHRANVFLLSYIVLLIFWGRLAYMAA